MPFRRVSGHDPAHPARVAPRHRALRIDAESDVAALVARQFALHDPNVVAQRAAASAMMQPLQARLETLQGDGNPMQWTDEVFIEAKWLLQYTTAWTRLNDTIGRFAAGFDIADQAAAVRQSPQDGSWGGAYTEWFLKLDASIDALNQLADDGTDAAYPLAFLAPVATPEAMRATLDGLLTSRIVHTGVDNRDALGSLSTFLSEVFFKSHLRKAIAAHTTGFAITDDLVAAYRAWQDQWQDAETGYWGAWYRDGHRVVKAPDLSFTFHTVSYRKGDVNHWPQILDTLLAQRTRGYPYGWLANGHYVNHNNYDVVKVLGYGWPHASDDHKAQAAAAIEDMLNWCLTTSLQPDCSFAIDEDFYSSVADAFYYGVVFLDVCGFWDPAKQFWRTPAVYPQAKGIAACIAARIEALKLTAESALAALAIVKAAAGG